MLPLRNGKVQRVAGLGASGICLLLGVTAMSANFQRINQSKRMVNAHETALAKEGLSNQALLERELAAIERRKIEQQQGMLDLSKCSISLSGFIYDEQRDFREQLMQWDPGIFNNALYNTPQWILLYDGGGILAGAVRDRGAELIQHTSDQPLVPSDYCGR